MRQKVSKIHLKDLTLNYAENIYVMNLFFPSAKKSIVERVSACTPKKKLSWHKAFYYHQQITDSLHIHINMPLSIWNHQLIFIIKLSRCNSHECLLHIVTNNNDWLWICWNFCRASLLKIFFWCVSVTYKINFSEEEDRNWWRSSIRGSSEFKEASDPIYCRTSHYSWHLSYKLSLDLISKNWSPLILRFSRLQIKLSLKFSLTISGDSLLLLLIIGVVHQKKMLSACV